ncbi:MAG: septal ring lytic transglycosylase RlpA family protein, partial [Bacteroidota bacterium]
MKKFAQLLATLIFVSATSVAFSQEFGLASYYSDKFQGKPTASGVSYDKKKFTAAHKTLPFGTIIKVTRLDSGKSVTVKVNDRGPYIGGRIVDLSRAAAEKLDLITDGTTQVKVEVVDRMTNEEVAASTNKKKETKKKESKTNSTKKESSKVTSTNADQKKASKSSTS